MRVEVVEGSCVMKLVVLVLVDRCSKVVVREGQPTMVQVVLRMDMVVLPLS